MSYEGIRDQILHENILSAKKAKSFSKTGVEKILHNVFYNGVVRWKGEDSPGSHELIIPQEHLDIVFNGKKGKHSLRPLGALSEFLTCKICGCSIIYDPKEKYIKSKDTYRKYTYYHCTDGKRVHKQNNLKQINIEEPDLFNQFEAMLDAFTINENTASKISNYLKEEHDKTVQLQKKQIQRDQQGIQAFEKQEDDLLELLMDRTIDEVAYQRKLQQIRDDKRLLASQVARLQNKFADGFMLKSESILELAKSAKSLWKSRSK